MRGIRIVMCNAHHNQLYYYDFELPTLRRQFSYKNLKMIQIQNRAKFVGMFIVKDLFDYECKI